MDTMASSRSALTRPLARRRDQQKEQTRLDLALAHRGRHRSHPGPRLRRGSVVLTAARVHIRRQVHGHASVYDASRDENNVYVHSNRPDQEATAKADGHSHSYRTDGSGYALIYLNGPPPGARITVTVGGATCTTSD